MGCSIPSDVSLSALRRLRRWIHEGLFLRAHGGFPALDGVRAFAALFIILYHSAFWADHAPPLVMTRLPPDWIRWFLQRCWIGVDIFFALSGFLIGRILLVQLREGVIDLKSFYIRRVFRIFPAYYLVLTLSLFIFARLDRFSFLYQSAAWEYLFHRSPANYAYISNYVYGARQVTAMGWGWSLCIEEHFYLLLPAFLVLLFRWGKRSVRSGVLLALPLLPSIVRAAALFKQPSIVVWQDLYWESHTHCDGLLLGVLIAYFFVWHPDAFVRFASRLQGIALGLALGCFASAFVWGGLTRPGFFPVVLQFFALALGTALVLVSVLGRKNLVARCLAHPFWYPIARVSYGMYLIHVFSVTWLFSLVPGARVALATSSSALLIFAACAALVSFVAASVLFLTVELPLLRWGTRLSRKQLVVVPETISLSSAAGR